ncbi:Anti-lipopolysaccharide factor/Scygonadin [Trinorchestia longiramus]|nr:Anti-lipopolysaccharide factor/Scygonadin [Trinorchestia longiramus]
MTSLKNYLTISASTFHSENSAGASEEANSTSSENEYSGFEKKSLSSRSSVNMQVMTSLNDNGKNTKSLKRHPLIRKMFLRFDSTLPSSALVERWYNAPVYCFTSISIAGPEIASRCIEAFDLNIKQNVRLEFAQEQVVWWNGNSSTKIVFFSHVVTSTSIVMGKASLIMVVLVAMLCANQAHAQGWQEMLVSQVVKQVISLWSKDRINLFGQKCTYKQSPSFSGIRLKWKNTLRCPGRLGSVKGYCKISSRRKGKACAIKNFTQNVINARLMTVKQIQTWLAQKKG